MAAKREISTRLVIEGEREYKAKIADINREYKTLDSQLKLVDSSFKGQANTLQALEAKNKALNDVIAKVTEKLKAEDSALQRTRDEKAKYGEAAQKAREKLEALQNTTDAATKETLEYQQQVALLQAEINKYENAEAKAAAAVDNHTVKANKAQIQLNDLNASLANNEKYLDEARKSSDGCATSIDKFGKEAKETGEQLHDAGGDAEKFGETSKEAIDTLAGALAAAGVAATIKEIADSLRECVDASVEFESAMAGVAKTTDLSKEELAAMGSEIKNITLGIPVTATEFAAINEVAGQLGVAKQDLLDFSTVMANLGVATNMTSDEAAVMLAQFAAVTGMDMSNIGRLGAAIVALGNNFATNERKITEMSQSIAGAGTNANISEADMLALSAAVTSLGIETQAGSTSMSKLIMAMGTAVETGEMLEEWAAAAGLTATEFAALWGRDATAAISAFVGNLNNLDESATVTLSNLEITESRMVRMITSLANAEQKTGTLTDAINVSNSAWDENIALIKEAETRYKTTESVTTLYKNSVQNLKIAVGDELTPALRNLAEAGMDVNVWAVEFIETHEGIVPVVTSVVVAMGVFVGGLAVFTVGATVATKAVAALNAAMNANPWMLAATAIAAVTAAIVTYTLTAEDGAQAAKDFRDEVEAATQAHEDAIIAINEEENNTADMIDALLELAQAEELSSGQKEIMLALINDLNVAIPNLNLSYNELTGKLALTAAEIREVAKAEADRKTYEENVKRLKDAYIEQEAATDNLAIAQARLAAAAENYDREAVEAGLATNGLAIAMADAGKEYSAAETEVQIYTEKAAELKTEIEGLETAVDGYANASNNAVPATQGLSEATSIAATQITSDLDALIYKYSELEASAYKNISQTISGFNEMAETVPTAIQSVMDALDSQDDFIDTYMENLAKAAELGLDEGLLTKLSDGSVESANILQGIVDDGGIKIQELNEKFREVSQGKEDFATTVASMLTDFTATSDDIVSEAEAMINDLNLKLEAYDSGAETIQGYIDGLNSGLSTLEFIKGKIGMTNSRAPKETGKDGSHAFGLDRVPYDGYMASLEEGEMVLTRAEARAYRAEQYANYYYPDNHVVNQKNDYHFYVPTKEVYDQIVADIDRKLGDKLS
jgi:TP901 family phage tail tape measure protein